MNVVLCPNCNSLVYKDIVNTTIRLCCLNSECKWKSSLLDSASFIEVKTIKEIKEDWQ